MRSDIKFVPFINTNRSDPDENELYSKDDILDNIFYLNPSSYIDISKIEYKLTDTIFNKLHMYIDIYND